MLSLVSCRAAARSGLIVSPEPGRRLLSCPPEGLSEDSCAKRAARSGFIAGSTASPVAGAERSLASKFWLLRSDRDELRGPSSVRFASRGPSGSRGSRASRGRSNLSESRGQLSRGSRGLSALSRGSRVSRSLVSLDSRDSRGLSSRDSRPSREVRES